MLRILLPRLALALLFLAGGIFAWYESIYLADQSRALGDGSILLWMWLFRLAAVLSVLAVLFFLWLFGRSILMR